MSNSDSLTFPLKKPFAGTNTLSVPDYQKRLYLLIISVLVIHIFLASVIEIGTDESYYWLYAQKLEWNYFDHPPMVALWARIFSLNLSLDQMEVFVRMGSIVSCALSSFFIYKTVATLHSDRAGWYAALLYNSSFYASLVAGLLIMPDSPQMLFWTFSCWLIVRILHNESKWSNWILFGVISGLCIMSKVHGAFLWIGLGLFTIVKRRVWLRKPHIYTSALVTAIIASPILIWNIQNDFATYNFHSERVSIVGRAFHYTSFYSELLGQLFFNNPFNVVLTVVAIIAARKKRFRLSPALSVFLLIGMPMALLLIFVSIFRPTFPHWSGPAYVSLIPIAAVYLAELQRKESVKRWLRLSFGSFLFFVIAWPLLVHNYPGTWGSKNAQQLGKGDVTLDRYGWKQGGEAFSVFYKNAIYRDIVEVNSPVVSNTWWGSHVEYYFSRPAKAEMIGLGPIKDIHHYMWVNGRRKDKVNMETALCIIPSDEYYNPAEKYSPYYDKAELVHTIDIYRNDRKAKQFYIYRLTGWKGQLPVWKQL